MVNSAWQKLENKALLWQKTQDPKFLEGLIEQLIPFTEGKIQRIFINRGLENYLSFHGDEIQSLAALSVWFALRRWQQTKGSLSHWLALYSRGLGRSLIRKIKLKLSSLYDPVGDDQDDLTLEDTLASDTPPPETVLSRKAFQEMLSSLPKRHRKVLTWRLQGETFGEIGKRLGVSRERARQLEAEARVRLRTFFSWVGIYFSSWTFLPRFLRRSLIASSRRLEIVVSSSAARILIAFQRSLFTMIDCLVF